MIWPAWLTAPLHRKPKPVVTHLDAQADAIGTQVETAKRESERLAMRAIAASQHFETANSRVVAFIAGVLAEAGHSKGSQRL